MTAAALLLLLLVRATAVPGLAAQSSTEVRHPEPVAIEAALDRDDQCSPGDKDCTLSALQHRSASLASRAQTVSVPDLSSQGARRLSAEVKHQVAVIKSCLKNLDLLEQQVNETKRILLASTPAEDDEDDYDEHRPSDKGAGFHDDEGEDEDEDAGGDEPGAKHNQGDDAEDGDEDITDDDDSWLQADSASSSSRRRHRPPPRMTAVQKMVNACEAKLKDIWKRTGRIDRLLEWCKAKERNPSTPDWEEEGQEGDGDEEDEDEPVDYDSLLALQGDLQGTLRLGESSGEANPQDVNMQRIVNQLVEEVKKAKDDLIRLKHDADEVRAAAPEAT